MKKILTAVAAGIALTVASCGGSNTPGTAPSTNIEMSGQAIKGTIIDGKVEVFRASDMTMPIDTIGTPTTDANGNYTFEVADKGWFNVAYVVKVSATADSTMICDAPTCGDVVFGETIPAAALTGLSLSSITSVNVDGEAEANVNVITTLTTDVLLAYVEADKDIKLSSVSKEILEKLQETSSEIVGDLIGVDLSETNVFDVKVVDATKYTADSVANEVYSAKAYYASDSGMEYGIYKA
jgi:hypothetical protein